MKRKIFILLCMIAAAFVFSACNNNDTTPVDVSENGAAVPPTQEIRDIPPEAAQARPATVVPPPPPPDARRDAAVEINLTEAPDPEPSPWYDAAEMVAQMRVGWNLGNSLDAHPHGNVLQFDRPVSTHETMWGNPVTTQENIQTIAAAGFDVLRVPVTWYARMVSGDDNYTIRQDWMDRVIEVVNWGLDEGMFVIVNTHHDEHIFGVLDEELEESKIVIARLWEQIGYVFRDYTHMLIFEGLNEPRTIGSPAEWNGGTPEERNNVNILNQVFVDTVRAIGGNNTNRMLMVPTYAASASNRAIQDFVLPQDPTNDVNKLIVSLHMYEPYNFALTLSPTMRTGWTTQNNDDTGPIVWGLDRAYNHFVSQGIPVIMGEMGALNRDNANSRAQWTYFYVSEAMAREIVCVWWDNGRIGTSLSQADGDHFGIFNRRTNEFPFPEIIDALMNASVR
ncbi:MAG: glycoside hydrolase family 5 protein [Defluviitaleaceae bacterium]|nr:glycoside hydrolase family 5 protein [Defluviitaleaceae bacterium]MCL2262097.1 glycoside hydrolase family 5 protein [Defluviitaleaceae bacterium]